VNALRSAWRAIGAAIAFIVNGRVFKPAVFILCALPLVLVGYEFAQVLTGRNPDALGADPSKALLEELGEKGLTILLATLTVTPIRRLFNVNRIQRVRRMLGVWSFSYIAIHLSAYLVFDQACYSAATCDYHAIWQDVLKRPYIFMGTVGFVILLALAITSTQGWTRRLKKNWARLHSLVYVAALAGIIHFIWIQKSGVSRPLPWIIWLAVVLGIRLYYASRKRLAAPRSPVTA